MPVAIGARRGIGRFLLGAVLIGAVVVTGGAAGVSFGASGGLGSFAVQLCKLIGATSIAIVGSEEKKILAEKLGADFVINRKSEELKRFVKDDGSPDLLSWNIFSNYLKKQGCPEIDCVFEHVGLFLPGCRCRNDR